MLLSMDREETGLLESEGPQSWSNATYKGQMGLKVLTLSSSFHLITEHHMVSDYKHRGKKGITMTNEELFSNGRKHATSSSTLDCANLHIYS